MTLTRFAPSPTGRLHVGNLRTALLNWLMARKAGGTFVLRLDDTDRARSEERHADAIRRDLEWLGLTWDRELRQSDRLERYALALERLRHAGRAYECFETPLELDLKRRTQRAMGKPPLYDRAALLLTEAERAELRRTRAAHWRFLLEPGEIAWSDMIRGAERVDAGSVSDPVLVRGDGQVLYTLASAVDDAEIGVTHVIRGADHVTNTSVQVQLFAALGAGTPAFGHHSLMTGPEGEALSKRLGSLALGDLRAAGIEPMALLAMLARLGTSRPVEPVTEMAGLIETFDPADFGRAPVRFDPGELDRLSARTLRALPVEAVADRLAALGIPEDRAAAFWQAVGPNLDRLEEAGDWWALCRDGAVPAIAPEDRDLVETALALLPPPPWGPDSWRDWTGAVKAATGRRGRALFLPLRRALTGRDHGPEMARLMPLLAPPRRGAD